MVFFMEKMIIGSKYGRKITRDEYDIFNYNLQIFGVERRVDMKYDTKQGRIIINDDNPDEIRDALDGRGYQEVKE